MQLAISTESLSRCTVEALEQAAALGFGQLEVNLQGNEFNYGYKRKPDIRFYRQLRQQLDSLGLSVWSVSTPPLTQEQMFYERARKDILMNGAGAAGILGAKVYVARPADLFTTEIEFESYWRENKAPAVIEGYDESWTQTVNRRMTLALLNKDHWIGAPLTNQAERMAKITNDLAIGCALDVRRALQRGHLAAWLEKVSDRLAVAYLYDLDENGAATPPMSDEWREWLPLLAQTRLKCVVVRAERPTSDEAWRDSRAYVEGIINRLPA